MVEQNILICRMKVNRDTALSTEEERGVSVAENSERECA